jgi:sulfite exporter TauE/SafE
MQIPEPTTFVFAVIGGMWFGLFTVPHCFGMCGPLHLAMCLASKKRSFKSLTLFNFGRIIGYTLIGVACGFFGEQLSGVFYKPTAAPTTQGESASVVVPKSCCEAAKDQEPKVIETSGCGCEKKANPAPVPKKVTVPRSCCEAAKANEVIVPKSCCEAAEAAGPTKPKMGLGETARRLLMFIFPAIILVVFGIKGILKKPAAVGTGGDGWLARLFKKFQASGPVACGVGASFIPCGILYVAFAIAVSTVSAFLGGVFMFFYCVAISFFMQLGIMVGTTVGKKFSAKVDRWFPWVAFVGAAVYVALFIFWK